jgi:hypothetical protein
MTEAAPHIEIHHVDAKHVSGVAWGGGEASRVWVWMTGDEGAVERVVPIHEGKWSANWGPLVSLAPGKYHVEVKFLISAHRDNQDFTVT